MLKMYTGSRKTNPLSVTTDIINISGTGIPKPLIAGSWKNIQEKYCYMLIPLLCSRASAFGLCQRQDTAEDWF